MKIKSQMLVIDQLNEEEQVKYYRITEKMIKSLNNDEGITLSKIGNIIEYAQALDNYGRIATKRFAANILNHPIVEKYKQDILNENDPVKLEKLTKELSQIVSNPYLMNNDDYDLSMMDIIKEEDPEGIPLHWFNDPNEPIELIPGLPMVIGAYSGVGKTTVMLNLLYHYFLCEKTQLVFTLEWRSKMLIRGLYKLHLKRNDTKGIIQKWDRKTIDAMMLKDESRIIRFNNTIKLKSNDNRIRKIDISDIEHTIESLFLRKQLPEIVYIDYLQRISNNEAEKRRLDARSIIMDTMFRLTQLSKKYKFIFILLAQTNRQGHNSDDIIKGKMKHLKAPDTKDLQESSSIEQDAAIVMTLGRVKDYDQPFDKMELVIVKNRFGYESTKYVNIHKSSSYMEEEADKTYNIDQLKENASLKNKSNSKPQNKK